jgi:hypothetical protein
MIIVYFETLNNSSAHVVAKFADDELYNACLPVLEAQAKAQGYMVTESDREDEEI